ncbi:mitochondrial carrier domain-containing protein [Dioszegia hungarica]|uniref:Mitochondrial carrier domain-containing protein n=1 Tax=Dioszegia hungarica TaxID=4972 RepID=A0AA38H709_9TREE|nr:mitochondrial carrier domain-containing protein [Dioszegia hungarica]KAI9633489.1 mitochondrial carrier domain-containing protein [Dioszegia hungarica]
MSNGESSKADVSPAVDFTAGVIAGVAGLVVGQPFDVVKVRYQTPEFKGRYTSIRSAFASIIREEGTHGLFKGVMSPMAGIAFINGVVFTSYSFFMKLQLPADSGQEPSLGQICLAGAGSGLASSLITCPTELIKIRQQSSPPHLNPSIFTVCRYIIRTDGARGLYRGFTVTALRDLAYGPYFFTYEASCRFFKSRRAPIDAAYPSQASSGRQYHHESLIDEAEMELHALRPWELMVAGGLAGVVAWMATFPLDVLKTRSQAASWQTDSAGSVRKKPPSIWRIANQAIRTEGWRVMFAGLGPTLIRAVPVNMVVFLTFEACVAGMSK